MHGADQRHIVRRPIVGTGAHAGAWRGDGRFVPGTYAWIIVVQFSIVRPASVAAVAQTQGQVSGTRMALSELLEYRKQLSVGLSKGDLRCLGASVALEIFGRDDAR